jgi:hypothetical protein
MADREAAARKRASDWYYAHREYVLEKRKADRTTESFKEWYERSRDQRNARAKERRGALSAAEREERKAYNRQYLRDRYRERQAWVRKIKAERGCLNCGERDVRKLHFHHRDPSHKIAKVGGGLLVSKMEKLVAEIAKCDVLCATCHREHHYGKPA